MSAKSWAEIGRELVRLGFLRQLPDKMNAVEITPEGMAALKSRQEIQLTRRPEEEKKSRVREQDEGSYDHQLFDHLRAFRKKLADEREVPAYVILSDVSLRQMAREYPVTSTSLARISGFGQKKLVDLGPLFLEEIRSWLDTHSRQSLSGSSRTKQSSSGSPSTGSGIAASPVPSRTSLRSLGNSARETLKSLRDGKSIPEIASARQLVESTIYSHVAEAITAGEKLDLLPFFTPEDFQAMKVAFNQFGFSNLTGVKEALQDRYSFELLRIARSALQAGRTP